jgi:hypothetical protein
MSIHLGYHGNQVHLDPQRYVPGIIREQTRTVIGVTYIFFTKNQILHICTRFLKVTYILIHLDNLLITHQRCVCVQ